MATTPIDMNSPISGPDTAVTASINQDSDAERDVKLIFKLMDEAKTARSQYDNDWSQRRDYYLDRQWYGPEELKKNKDKYFLLDIRRPEDYAKGHIPGTKNIFWLDLLKPENLKKLPKDKKIVVICYVGHTASQIMVLLKLLGYDVVALKFGMGISPTEGVPVAGWVDYGFEITK